MNAEEFDKYMKEIHQATNDKNWDRLTELNKDFGKNLDSYTEHSKEMQKKSDDKNIPDVNDELTRRVNVDMPNLRRESKRRQAEASQKKLEHINNGTIDQYDDDKSIEEFEDLISEYTGYARKNLEKYLEENKIPVTKIDDKGIYNDENGNLRGNFFVEFVDIADAAWVVSSPHGVNDTP